MMAVLPIKSVTASWKFTTIMLAGVSPEPILIILKTSPIMLFFLIQQVRFYLRNFSINVFRRSHSYNGQQRRQYGLSLEKFNLVRSRKLAKKRFLPCKNTISRRYIYRDDDLERISITEEGMSSVVYETGFNLHMDYSPIIHVGADYCTDN